MATPGIHKVLYNRHLKVKINITSKLVRNNFEKSIGKYIITCLNQEETPVSVTRWS